MTNKKDQHRRSVETLGLSGNGDERIIAEVDDLIHHHEPNEPYSRNTLWRIKYLIDKYFETEGVLHDPK